MVATPIMTIMWAPDMRRKTVIRSVTASRVVLDPGFGASQVCFAELQNANCKLKIENVGTHLAKRSLNDRTHPTFLL